MFNKIAKVFEEEGKAAVEEIKLQLLLRRNEISTESDLYLKANEAKMYRAHQFDPVWKPHKVLCEDFNEIERLIRHCNFYLDKPNVRISK